MQTTQTEYDPAISGELTRPLNGFRDVEFNIGKVIAGRVAQEIKDGWAVNIGFGISANVPRILVEEGLHGIGHLDDRTRRCWRHPAIGYQARLLGQCRSFRAIPAAVCSFQAGGFDAAVLSFPEIDKHGSVNVSRLSAIPHARFR